MGLFLQGQLAYCPKRNMAREKQRPSDGRKGELPAGPEAPPEAPPARAAAYIPPMAVPKESRYHTIDMKAVRLSPDIDPQRMKTQLSLRAVQAAKPPSGRMTRWLALLLVGGAIGTCAWWFSRWRLTQSQDNVGVPMPLVGAGVAVSPPRALDVGSHVATPRDVAAPLAPTIPSQTRALGAPETSPVPSGSAETGLARSGVAVAPPNVPNPVKVPTPARPAPKTRLPRKVNPPAASGELPKTDSNPPRLWLE